MSATPLTEVELNALNSLLRRAQETGHLDQLLGAMVARDARAVDELSDSWIVAGSGAMTDASKRLMEEPPQPPTKNRAKESESNSSAMVALTAAEWMRLEDASEGKLPVGVKSFRQWSGTLITF